jgi:hypothetical protein
MKIISFRASICLLLITLALVSCSGTGFGMFKKAEKVNPGANNLLEDYMLPNATRKDTDIPDMPLYWEGWIKYLHYSPGDKKEAKAFWKNPEFENQARRGVENINSKDEVIYK